MILSALFGTNRNGTDVQLLILRVALAVVIFPHGAQKMFGWFGGPGFGGTMQMFTQGMHLPAIVAVLPILTEVFGPIFLVLGLLTRPWAFALAFDMLVAMMLVHLPNGFFMNWTGQQKGEGIEFFVFAVAIGLALTIVGAGRLSLDSRLATSLGERA